MPTFSGLSRMTKVQKYSATGITAAGVAALALTVVPGSADAGSPNQSAATKSVAAQPVAFTTEHSAQSKSIQGQLDAAQQRARNEAAAKQADAKKAAEEKAKKEREEKAAANRSAARQAPKTYPNNLDGWIREALSIMDEHNIPGTYAGIHRNIIRESGGNPNAVNNWDINAQKGTPSKGLLQVIKPTFDRYHVQGTPYNLTDPVANIVAACNYAADRYGSMDNVNSAY